MTASSTPSVASAKILMSSLRTVNRFVLNFQVEGLRPPSNFPPIRECAPLTTGTKAPKQVERGEKLVERTREVCSLDAPSIISACFDAGLIYCKMLMLPKGPPTVSMRFKRQTEQTDAVAPNDANYLTTEIETIYGPWMVMLQGSLRLDCNFDPYGLTVEEEAEYLRKRYRNAGTHNATEIERKVKQEATGTPYLLTGTHYVEALRLTPPAYHRLFAHEGALLLDGEL
ncbi:MAG: hypothetical protein V4519_00695 [Patescibacteria group bacterium]